MARRRPRLANAPCSWGVLEFELEADPAAGPARVLAEMQQAGFEGTELGDWGFLPAEPRALGQTLARHELALVGAFVPLRLDRSEAHPEGVQRALRTARLLAEVAAEPLLVLADDNGKVPARVAHAGRVTPELGLDPDAWQRVAQGAQAVARAVRHQTGLRTVVHHHCGGYLETPAEVQRLLELTDPELVGLCLDTGHWHFAGGDALAALRQHGDRVWHVHFKDCHAELTARSRRQRWGYFESVRQGVFCELGQGEVDFAGVLAELERMDYDGWIVVEQDVLPGMGSPLDSAVRNRAFLRGLGL